MCSSYDSECNSFPIAIEIKRDKEYLDCYDFIKFYAKEVVEIVEKWIKEHPAKTRQSMLLEIFPNVSLDNDGVLSICPQHIDKTIICFKTCSECCKDFWTEEIE